MADFVNNAFWYTVWDAKSGDLLASGTAAMCARRLGYASANSFAASVCHWLKDGRQHVKYIYQRELIPRSEVDSLPRKPKGPPVFAARTSPRVMDSLLPITQKNNTLWRFCKWIRSSAGGCRATASMPTTGTVSGCGMTPGTAGRRATS